MKAKEFDYTGKENLDVMVVAKNYNDFLINEILAVYPDKKQKSAKVLDFGSGTGTYADLLKEMGGMVECLEPDKDYQAILKKKGYAVKNHNSQLKDNDYDLIYALNVFEHIEDDAGEMKLLFNKVKKGGHIVVYVPAFQLLFSSMDKNVGHYRRYRLDGMEGIVKDAGFSIVKSGYRDPIGFFAALAFKIAGNSSGDLSANSVKSYDRLLFPTSHTISRITSPLFGKNVLVVAKKV